MPLFPHEVVWFQLKQLGPLSAVLLGGISRLVGSGLTVRNPDPLNITAQKPEDTRFVPFVLLRRQTVRTCPVSQGKDLVSLSREINSYCRGRWWLLTL